MKVHCLAGDHRASKILSLLITANTACEVYYLDPDTYIRDPQFIKLSPFRKAPVLECEIGSFFETNAILKYLAKRKSDTFKLIGTTPKEEAEVNQWMDFCSSELDPLLQVIYFPFLDYMEQDERQGRALRSIKEALQFIDNSIKKTGYLVGNGSTLADLSLAVSLLCPFEDIFMETFSPDLPKLTLFLQRMKTEFKIKNLPKCFRELKRLDLKQKK